MLMGIQSVDISSQEGSNHSGRRSDPSMTAGINPANATGIVHGAGGQDLPQRDPGKSTGDSGCGGCHRLYGRRQDGDQVVLDGSTSEVYVKPDQAVTADYEEKRKQFLAEKKELERYIGKTFCLKGRLLCRWKSWLTLEARGRGQGAPV